MAALTWLSENRPAARIRNLANSRRRLDIHDIQLIKDHTSFLGLLFIVCRIDHKFLAAALIANTLIIWCPTPTARSMAFTAALIKISAYVAFNANDNLLWFGKRLPHPQHGFWDSGHFAYHWCHHQYPIQLDWQGRLRHRAQLLYELCCREEIGI
jgi:hypothetical protein